jgi:hypothetical protein
MGEDARNTTEINFGRFKLDGFPAGSLTVSGQHALPDYDSWPFSFKVPNNQVNISIGAPATLGFRGKMQLTCPITGYIIERISSDGCRRELRVKDNVLVKAVGELSGGSEFCDQQPETDSGRIKFDL